MPALNEAHSVVTKVSWIRQIALAYTVVCMDCSLLAIPSQFQCLCEVAFLPREGIGGSQGGRGLFRRATGPDVCVHACIHAAEEVNLCFRFEFCKFNITPHVLFIIFALLFLPFRIQPLLPALLVELCAPFLFVAPLIVVQSSQGYGRVRGLFLQGLLTFGPRLLRALSQHLCILLVVGVCDTL